MTRSLKFFLLLASITTYWHGANGHAHHLKKQIYLQGEDGAQDYYQQLNDNHNNDDNSDGMMMVDDGGNDDGDPMFQGNDDNDGDDDDDGGDDDDGDDDVMLESDNDDDDGVDKMSTALKVSPAFQGLKWRKIKFDYSTDVDEQLLAYSSDEEPEESAHQQLENMRWVAVTAHGYEYEGDLDEAKELMAEVMAEDTEEGIELGNEGDGDVPENGHQRHRRKVFGYDSRQLVKNTYRFPYSAMGRVDIGCTGTFISPRHVLTAAHCVFNRKTRRWYKNLNFRRRKACHPYLGKRHIWKHAVTVKGYTKYGLISYDYALITYYTPSPVWMSYGYTTHRHLRSGFISIAGYPGDKNTPKQCLWRSSCSVCRYPYRVHRFFYRCDTAKGMSGSAVYKYTHYCRRRVIYGIHAYGGSTANSATRITSQRFRQLRRWIKKYI